jgi:hypothetical protein
MYFPFNSFIVNVVMRWPVLAAVVAACGACYAAYKG